MESTLSSDLADIGGRLVEIGNQLASIANRMVIEKKDVMLSDQKKG